VLIKLLNNLKIDLKILDYKAGRYTKMTQSFVGSWNLVLKDSGASDCSMG
jgi:hypothetical protein